VRLIDQDKKQLGIVDIKEALRIAQESGLDLVEVAANASPPVCRIMDYGKFKYQEKKHRGKAKKTETKEIRIRLSTSPHDLEFKINQAKRFLKKGNKVRIFLHLRGREKAHQDLGREKIKTFIENLSEEIQNIKIDQQIKNSPRGLETIITS
jgi:translation initiation factor IF-3